MNLDSVMDVLWTQFPQRPQGEYNRTQSTYVLCQQGGNDNADDDDADNGKQAFGL